jgi:hypothetical protein
MKLDDEIGSKNLMMINFFCLKNNLLAMGYFDLMMSLMCEEATKCT